MLTQKGYLQMNRPVGHAKLDTSYYGQNGGIAPLFSCGSQALAPSFLTGNGSHMVLWTSVVIHLLALALNMTANIMFLVNIDSAMTLDLWTGWAVTSLLMHSLGVIGAVVCTGIFKDPFATPLINTVGIGFFLCGVLATAKISYTHSLTHTAESGENVTYNLSLFFQAFGIASLVSNGLCALSTKVGI